MEECQREKKRKRESQHGLGEVRGQEDRGSEGEDKGTPDRGEAGRLRRPLGREKRIREKKGERKRNKGNLVSF